MAAQDMSEHLLEEILVKLPIKTLGRFKSVSRTWKSLIESPSFVLHQLSVSKQRRSFTEQLLRQDTEAFTKICITHDRTSQLDWTYSEDNVLPPCVDGYDHHRWFHIIVDSGLGVYCLVDKYSHSNEAVIWNPTTRQSMILPPMPTAMHQKHGDAAFGFSYNLFGFGCSMSNGNQTCSNILELKFIRQRIDDLKQFEIYSSNTKSWRVAQSNLERVVNDAKPLFFLAGESSRGVNLRGMTHWIVKCGRDYAILSFNFDSETFALLRLPRTILQSGCSQYKCTLFDDKYLCIVGWIEAQHEGHIWVMFEYGVQETWRKHATYRLDGSLEFVWLRGYCSSIEGVIFSALTGFYVHNCKSAKIMRIVDDIQCFPKTMVSLTSYVESLISVN